MAWIRHDSHEKAVIKNQQALGSASPLETDDDGYAELEEATADLLAALDAHVELASAPASDDGDDGSTGDEFDADAFVDRTPMDDVISDLETGEYDSHLDAIEAAATREGVLDAVEQRREA